VCVWGGGGVAALQCATVPFGLTPCLPPLSRPLEHTSCHCCSCGGMQASGGDPDNALTRLESMTDDSYVEMLASVAPPAHREGEPSPSRAFLNEFRDVQVGWVGGCGGGGEGEGRLESAPLDIPRPAPF
jgi:hypothetical protein